MSRRLKYLSVPVWDEADGLTRSLISGALSGWICHKFPKGVHEFRATDELFDALGAGHVAWQTVSVQNLCLPELRLGGNPDYPLFYMSKRMFGKLIHGLKSVRIRQNPWDLVEREGVPRLYWSLANFLRSRRPHLAASTTQNPQASMV